MKQSRNPRTASARVPAGADTVSARASAGADTKVTNRAAAKAPVRRSRFPKSVSTAIEAARDKKAFDIVVLDLRKAGGFTDFFVICTGANPRQISAIADAVREALKQQGERPAVTEGSDASAWVLLDYFNFVVHVFSRECRAFYDLERLWGDASRHEIPPAGTSLAS